MRVAKLSSTYINTSQSAFDLKLKISLGLIVLVLITEVGCLNISLLESSSFNSTTPDYSTAPLPNPNTLGDNFKSLSALINKAQVLAPSVSAAAQSIQGANIKSNLKQISKLRAVSAMTTSKNVFYGPGWLPDPSCGFGANCNRSANFKTFLSGLLNTNTVKNDQSPASVFGRINKILKKICALGINISDDQGEPQEGETDVSFNIQKLTQAQYYCDQDSTELEELKTNLWHVSVNTVPDSAYYNKRISFTQNGTTTVAYFKKDSTWFNLSLSEENSTQSIRLMITDRDHRSVTNELIYREKTSFTDFTEFYRFLYDADSNDVAMIGGFYDYSTTPKNQLLFTLRTTPDQTTEVGISLAAQGFNLSLADPLASPDFLNHYRACLTVNLTSITTDNTLTCSSGVHSGDTRDNYQALGVFTFLVDSFARNGMLLGNPAQLDSNSNSNFFGSDNIFTYGIQSLPQLTRPTLALDFRELNRNLDKTNLMGPAFSKTTNAGGFSTQPTALTVPSFTNTSANLWDGADWLPDPKCIHSFLTCNRFVNFKNYLNSVLDPSAVKDDSTSAGFTQRTKKIVKDICAATLTLSDLNDLPPNSDQNITISSANSNMLTNYCDFTSSELATARTIHVVSSTSGYETQMNITGGAETTNVFMIRDSNQFTLQIAQIGTGKSTRAVLSNQYAGTYVEATNFSAEYIYREQNSPDNFGEFYRFNFQGSTLQMNIFGGRFEYDQANPHQFLFTLTGRPEMADPLTGTHFALGVGAVGYHLAQTDISASATGLTNIYNMILLAKTQSISSDSSISAPTEPQGYQVIGTQVNNGPTSGFTHLMSALSPNGGGLFDPLNFGSTLWANNLVDPNFWDFYVTP